MNKTIACVVPTIRPESYKKFLVVWKEQFEKHNVVLITVADGENPTTGIGEDYGASLKTVMGEYSDLIYNFNDGVRNLGFAWVARYMPEIDTIISLDDDTEPFGDTIGDHLKALEKKVPVSWISTLDGIYPRGFPYGIRNEAEVVLSHGGWEGVPDLDAPTQLVNGIPDFLRFYVGPIPRGIFYPMASMNIAFKRKMLPYMYQAPMGSKTGLDRFADIWCGIESKKVIDEKGWAVVTGYAYVKHNKASNVFTNLIKEAKGIVMNENYGQPYDSDYFGFYEQNRKRWKEFCEN